MQLAGRCVAQRVEQRVAPLAVDLAEGLDLLQPGLGLQVARDRQLVEGRRAQDLRLAGEHQLLAYAVRGQDPADPQARGDRLAEGAQVEHAIGAVGPDRPERLVVEAEQAVRVVLDDQQVGLLGDGQDLLAAGEAERDAGRVLVVGDEVEELDLLARFRAVGDRLAQRRRASCRRRPSRRAAPRPAPRRTCPSAPT